MFNEAQVVMEEEEGGSGDTTAESLDAPGGEEITPAADVMEIV